MKGRIVLVLIFVLIFCFEFLNCKSGSGKTRDNGPKRKDGGSDRRYRDNRCTGKSNSDGSCDRRDKRNKDL